MAGLNETVKQVTERIRVRSRTSRAAYEAQMAAAAVVGTQRGRLNCGNLAHGFAACAQADKAQLSGTEAVNIGIVTAYNDMLSAHQPFSAYPDIIKEAAREVGATAQVAGGVPAMCDGVTQGQAGMDLSLFSRDVIAMGTAVALSHAMFDAAVCLGVCDKIVPGLVMGAARFGHLPFVFVPAGPMPSGLSNEEKARVRKAFAKGEVGKDALLAVESASYHAPGTCTFYGTANTNQMLMEIMGLHLAGASFVPPGTPLRRALTRAAAHRVAQLVASGAEPTPLWRIVDDKAVVNGVVGLLATGGSTNHTLHLVAMAAAAGVQLTWDDIAELSAVVPLVARVYPNGGADVNHFHAAGGMAYLMGQLLGAGLLHEDVHTVMGMGLTPYTLQPVLDGESLSWQPGPRDSADRAVLRPVDDAFASDGGLKVLSGNLGRAVIKVSAVAAEHQVVQAPAAVFDSQQALAAAFKRGELDRDVIAVVRFQGPSANGMPELHGLTPPLSVLQERGHRVALVTDGRMSGASGRVPAAIHVTPEALSGGPLGRVRDGDVLRLDARAGVLEACVPPEVWNARQPARPSAALLEEHRGCGRELFGWMRRAVGGAEQGATVFDFLGAGEQ